VTLEVKFGVFLPFYAFPAGRSGKNFQDIKNLILEADHLGFDCVWLDDHLMYPDWSILEPWTTLSALAALTKKVRLGTLVSCMAHRNPALLAKTAATLDVISDGRLELGVGAGIGAAEHEAYGFDFAEPKVRVERLAESVELIRRLWTQDRASFEGKYFRLQDAVCLPKPTQKPHPPITVGGKGQLLLRTVTAPYADRFDFGYLRSIEVYKKKLETLEKTCRTVGRDFGSVEKSCWPGAQVIVAQNKSEVEKEVAKKNPLGLSLEEFKRVNSVGTPAQIREQLQPWLDLGVTYFMLYFGDLPDAVGPRLFAEEVMKPMRC